MRLVVLALATACIALPAAAFEMNPVCSDVAADITVAMSFYPDSLRSDDPTAPVEPQVCVQRASFGGTSGGYLVAAYSNAHIGALRVIRMSGTPAVVADAPMQPAPAGNTPGLQLLDFNGDGTPEILFNLLTRGNPSTWLLAWTGNGLQNIGPTTPSGDAVLTNLRFPTFEDLNGDGLPEIIQSNATPWNPEPQQKETVYSVGPNGSVVPAKPIAFWGVFVRKEANPAAVTTTFVPASTGKHVLRIVNGTPDGKNLVTAADVVLNGVMVVNPGDFKKKGRVIEVPVTLTASNELRVELRSTPGSQFTLSIAQP